MSRRLPLLALLLIGLQACEVLILGTSRAGSLVANSLQLAACALGIAMTWSAYQRGRGLSRPFWLLISAGLATWGLANLGWMYYENWLHQPVPELSVIRIVFDSEGVFFAVVLFLDKERDSPRFDLETLLDALQVAILFFSAFFGMYYVRLLSGSIDTYTDTFMAWSYLVTNIALTVFAGVVLISVRTQKLRSLYGGLAIFLLINTVASGTADYAQSLRDVPAGTWYDLGWSLPFLVCAMWASRWKESAEGASEITLRRKSPGAVVIKNLALGLAPLTVLVLVAQLGTEWRGFGFFLVGLSITCYAARLGVVQYREGLTAVLMRRQTTAMDSAMDSMAIVSTEGKYTYANGAFARMLGYDSQQELIGKTWAEVSDPRDMASVREDLQTALEKRGKWFGAVTVHSKNGTPIPLEVAVTRLPDGGVVTISRDVSDQRRAESSRRRAEKQYQTLVEQVAAISYIAEVGMEGLWFYVSPQIETIFGFTADEWLASSQKWAQHIHPDDIRIVEAAEEASKRGEKFQAEYRVIRKDGRTIWVSDTAVVVPGSDLHPVMEGIIVDITDRKQLEGQLQQARRMEAVGRLAGGIAHDFNNLLTIIKGYTELGLTRSKNYPEIRSDLERIEDASERAAGLVRQLLAFSRRQLLQPKVLDLNAIVVGLDKLLRRLMDEDIEMKTVVADKLGMIKADPGQIEQVIMNLVVNARDAMAGGGRLIVETANVNLDEAYARDHATVRPGRYVMLAVSDTGMGMSADTIAHIFEPFYTTKESGQGTGLGLSTVYGIVKQSGGYVWVYSEQGHGTTFKVYLPRVDEPADVLPATKDGARQRTGTETILLVEDEPQLRELTRSVLAARGYSVMEAAGPADAQSLAEEHGAKIHLLLTDVIMPGISGRELAKRLSARHPTMRVLYMSGYTYNVIAQGGTLERGVSFLQKPFTPSVLIEKVREVLDSVLPAR